MDSHGAATWASIAESFRSQAKIDQDKHDVVTKCTHCGKERGEALRSCTRCKAARYCNEKCQRADYAAGHKHECNNFVHPPRTRAFRYKPVDTAYPNSPIFAQGHEDGVGCWVSGGAQMTCQLQQLARQIRMASDDKFAARIQSVFSQSEKLPAASKRNLISFQVLVQNRRKDNAPVLVFGGRAQVVTTPSAIGAVLGGRVANEKIVTFTRNGVDRLALSIPKDPWSHAARVLVTYVNGQQTHEPPYPKSLPDPAEAIVALHPGDWAIIHLQFRVGDDKTITKEYQALRCLDRLALPFIRWDGVATPAALASSLPNPYTLASYSPNPGTSTAPKPSPSPSPSSAPATGTSNTPHALSVMLDQAAITEYYADFINHGEDVFMRTHHGSAQAELTREHTQTMAELTAASLTLGGRSLDDVIAGLHKDGWGEFMERYLAGRG